MARTFDAWLAKFHHFCQGRTVLTNHELRAAWEEGCSPKQVAKANDDLVAEYAEVYGDEWEDVAA